MDLTPISGIRKGSFISTGASLTLDLLYIPDWFVWRNITQMSSVANPGVVKKAEWFSGMADASALIVKNTAGLATDESSIILTGGFTQFDQSVPQTFAFQALAAVASVTQANPAVVTSAAAHGLTTGDIVRLTNIANMAQINGIDFSVTVTGATTFTIPLNATGFAAAGAGGFLQKQFPPGLFQPKRRIITSITQANPGVVTTSTEHGYSSLDIERLYIPSGFGMTQANLLQVQITVLTSTTFSIGVDTTAFTAFAFPTSASVPFTFAQSVPVGENTLSLADPMRNTGIRGLILGSSVAGSLGDVIQWVAFKGTV